ncbi:MAG: diaminopimelate decarboxylase [Thermoplasmata archaeon]
MWGIGGVLENIGGVLYIDGCSSVELVKRYGTPLYVMAENGIRNNYRRLHRAFSKHVKKFKIYYAVKANSNLSVLSILRQEGSRVDCSCVEEMELTERAGFGPGDLLFTGNYTGDSDLRKAIEKGILINLDDISIAERLFKIGTPSTISFRINPGMGEGKFKVLVFGGSETKFGIEEKTALRAYELAKLHGVKRFGIHMMAGSCILNEEYFRVVTERLLAIAQNIAKTLKIEFEFINTGGGFGIPYKPGEREINVEKAAKAMSDVFKLYVEEGSIGDPYTYIEPGRYIVGNAGIILARVQAIKRGCKEYVGIDAGMNTLLRPALYGAYHHMYLANRLDSEATKRVSICGQVCENTDILAKDREFPDVRLGDIVAIHNAGAYGYTMSSQYNTRPKPAEVLANNGESELIRERETTSDMTRGQKVPKRLMK